MAAERAAAIKKPHLVTIAVLDTAAVALCLGALVALSSWALTYVKLNHLAPYAPPADIRLATALTGLFVLFTLTYVKIASGSSLGLWITRYEYVVRHDTPPPPIRAFVSTLALLLPLLCLLPPLLYKAPLRAHHLNVVALTQKLTTRAASDLGWLAHKPLLTMVVLAPIALSYAVRLEPRLLTKHTTPAIEKLCAAQLALCRYVRVDATKIRINPEIAGFVPLQSEHARLVASYKEQQPAKQGALLHQGRDTPKSSGEVLKTNQGVKELILVA